jgi:hypothetical protein
MTARLEMTPVRNDRHDTEVGNADSSGLVIVANGPPNGRGVDGHAQELTGDLVQLHPSATVTDGIRCVRIAPHVVGQSAEWCRRRVRKIGVRPLVLEKRGTARADAPELPLSQPRIREILEQEEGPWADHEITAAAILALRNADAVIAGPLSPEEASSPGLFPHLADLACEAYRALRPPRSLIAHPAFGQTASLFHYIQMNDQEARALGAGAIDIATLALRLRYLQGEAGEFAITAFNGRGLVWADQDWWEIDRIGNMDGEEVAAENVFCMAWVVARQFRGADAPQALDYARAAVSAAIKPKCG